MFATLSGNFGRRAVAAACEAARPVVTAILPPWSWATAAWNAACSPDCRTPVTNGWQASPAMQASPIYIVTQRRDLATRYATATRQWLVARTTYRRLHEAPVKNLSALRDAARRLDLLERGRAALLRDLKALG